MWRKYSHVGNIKFFEEPDSGINDLFLLAPSTGLEPVTYRLGGDCSILLRAGREAATTGEIAKALYAALRVFYLGVTLERYYEKENGFFKTGSGCLLF